MFGLGVGLSDHPDGILFVQSSVEIELLYQLILHFKADKRFAKATSFIGVGHSYGRSAPRIFCDVQMIRPF